MTRDQKEPTTKAQADTWEVVNPLLGAMYTEFKELSKKKPEGALSKQKIKVANRLLTKCQEVLKGEESLEFLDLFDEDDVPQHSDAALMLSQYAAAMQQFHGAHHGWDDIAHNKRWFIKG